MNNPELYRRNLDVITNFTRVLYKQQAKHLKWSKEPVIMDVGIGDGTMTKDVILSVIPKDFKEYLGVDISENMLRSAKRTVKHPKFKTLQLDITTKNIPGNLLNKFTHIFASYSFNAVENIQQTATNIYHMLAPGGQLFFNTFTEGPTNETYRKLDQTKWAKYSNNKALSCFHDCNDIVGEYNKLLKDVGFTNLYIHTQKSDWFFSEEAVEGLLEAINLRLAFVDEKDKNQYIRDYINIAKQTKAIHFDSSKNKFVIHLNVLTGIANKPFFPAY